MFDRLRNCIAGTVVVDVDGTERDVSGLSLPLMKEVRADHVCLN